jgi:hypothetical protein
MYAKILPLQEAFMAQVLRIMEISLCLCDKQVVGAMGAMYTVMQICNIKW